MGIEASTSFGGGGGDFRHESVLIAAQAQAFDTSWGVSLHNGIVAHYILAYGTEEQKRKWLPKLCSGEWVGAIGMTEPGAGSDLAGLATRAVRDGDDYVINGQKVWISRVQHSDLMILLARTTPLDQVAKKSEGMSIFLVDIKEAMKSGMTVRPILNMVNHETNELFFDNLEIPVENLIGEEGKGFKYILGGLNPERMLVAAEALGLGRAALRKAAQYGILIRGGEALEQARRIDAVVLDKTGTVTTGVMTLQAVHVSPGETDDEVLAVAAALEAASEHPIARAVVRAAPAPVVAVDDFAAVPGLGVRGVVGGRAVVVGAGLRRPSRPPGRGRDAG